jgi:hypothetical protein
MMDIFDNGSILPLIRWKEINSDDAKKAVLKITEASEQHSVYVNNPIQQNEGMVSQLLRQACK